MSNQSTGQHCCACEIVCYHIGPPSFCEKHKYSDITFPKPEFPLLPSTKGWICPRCSSVYSPTQNECWKCNGPAKPTCNTGEGNE